VSYSRRQVLGLTGIAVAGAAGAGAGLGLGRADRTSGRQEPAKPQQDYRAKPLWRFRIADPQDVVLTAAGSVMFAANSSRLYALGASDGSVLWDAPAPQATPATSGDLVYVMGDDGRLSARNIRSGSKSWDFPNENGGASTPVLADSVLYVGGAEIWALAARTGRPLWQVPSASDANGVLDSPITVTGNTLFTSTSSMIRALDKKSGTEKWRYFSPFGSFSVGPEIAPDVICCSCSIYNSSQSILFGLDANSGERLWTVTFPVGVFAIKATDTIIYAAGSETGSNVPDGTYGAGEPVVISALAARSGSSVWTRTLENLNPTFVAAGKTAIISPYATRGPGGITYPGGPDSQTGLSALSLSDGRIKWQVTSAGWALTSPPVIAGAWACAGFAQQSIRVVNVGTGQTKWNMPMDLVSGPAVSDGVVFGVAADSPGPLYSNASIHGSIHAVRI
jgi:outer membrane protein assembly factor BamB